MTHSNQPNERSGAVDGANEFHFGCPDCDDVIRATTAGAVKERGKTHLEENHYAELSSAFGEVYGGEHCHDDCGYVFPVNGDSVAGFDCPNCGSDNFRPFVRRYLYWQIEVE